MQALSNHFGKNADVYQQVEFDTEGKISLDISDDGINSRGWRITPLSCPVVRTLLPHPTPASAFASVCVCVTVCLSVCWQ